MTLPPLRLKKNEDRRLRAGHLWVFSNEVDTAHSPLSAFQPGDPVDIQDSRGATVGSGYVNPHSLICARMISHRAGRVLGRELLVERLQRALALRERLYGGEPFYRLVYGEADGIPGLVVDRFGDVLVTQITTAGVERVRDAVVNALGQVVPGASILLRNDTASRSLEGLPSYVETVGGDVPERMEVSENGVRFDVALRQGQKTGWFFDHRENRARLRRYVVGSRVLDVFSYVGAWGIQAATAGAERVVCVDSSAAALDSMRSSALLNGVSDRVEALRGDAFEVLAALREGGERFDVVVLDPPGFIKRRKDARQGEQAYLRINKLAMDLIADGGIIISASCSHHLSREKLQDVMLRASRELRRDLQLLEEGGQGPDHPVHPAIPETSYLKAFFGRVLF
jgi:23S rRNA (cytosine1962-C5)-methyltransferase